MIRMEQEERLSIFTFCASVLFEFCFLETHIYRIINFKRQGLRRQVFPVKYSHRQVVKTCHQPQSALVGKSEQKFRIAPTWACRNMSCACLHTCQVSLWSTCQQGPCWTDEVTGKAQKIGNYPSPLWTPAPVLVLLLVCCVWWASLRDIPCSIPL